MTWFDCPECGKSTWFEERDNKIEALEQTILGYQAAVELLKEERDKAEADNERLRELLCEARDYVAEVVAHNRDNYGDRLQYKQRPAIELLERIDAARKPKSDADILPVYFEPRKP